MEVASVQIAIQFGGACAFTPDIIVEQVRADTGAGLPESVDVDLDFDSSLYDAITAPIRWTRPRFVYDGIPVVLSRVGPIAAGRDMSTQLQTFSFGTVGPLWSMPTSDPIARVTDPCPPTIASPAAGRSPLAWGNKKVELFLGFLKSKDVLKEIKVFQGYSYQRGNRGDTQITGAFTAVDDSILYAKVPICYQLPPFAGKRRGEIVKEIAASIGIDPAQVIVPVGKEVTKPLILSNEHLLPFLEEFGAPENWLPYFDEFGRLVIEEIEIQTPAPWTYDAAAGDFELDSFQEEIPSSPPTRYYVTGSEPVKGGPGGLDQDVTSKTTEQIEELYAPQTDKVRPSGGASFLYADGSYRSIAHQELMTIARRTSFRTTRNGLAISSRELMEAFYDPKAFDPNFNSDPPGTSYNAAFGNKTFHRDEVERLVLVEEGGVESSFDREGTLQRQVQKTRGYYSPQHALLHASDPRSNLHNFPGVAYVYPGGIMRADPVETLREIKRIESGYSYGAAGALEETLEETFEWFSPKSRADIVAVQATPDVPPIPILDSPPLPNPPPPAPPPAPPAAPPPPTRTPWAPRLIGPTRRFRNVFYFDLDVSSMPRLASGVTAVFADQHFYLTGSASLGAHVPVVIVYMEQRDMGGGLYAFRERNVNGTLSLTSAGIIQDAFRAVVQQTTSTDPLVKPTDLEGAFVYGVVEISGGVDAGQYKTPSVYFDPWADADPAGLMVMR